MDVSLRLRQTGSQAGQFVATESPAVMRLYTARLVAGTWTEPTEEREHMRTINKLLDRLHHFILPEDLRFLLLFFGLLIFLSLVSCGCVIRSPHVHEFITEQASAQTPGAVQGQALHAAPTE